MAEFGWAYIGDGAIREAKGVTGSVMLKQAEKEITGSSKLIFNTSSNTLVVTGDISSSINVSASSFYGSGGSLTALNATNVAAGTLNNARLPAAISITSLTSSGHISSSHIYGSNLTIGGFTSTGNSVVTGSLTISGSLYANELVTNVTSKNVVNISATGSTKFGDTVDDTHVFTGSIKISSSTHPLYITGLQPGTRNNANSYLAVDSSGRIILTSSVTTTQSSSIASSGDTGQIGAAEDGAYSDGLFTDFASSTPVGTAVDRFNEVLKILAPSPAPALKSARADETNGVSAKLSFGAGEDISGYVNYSTGLTYTNASNALTTIFSAVAQNSIFQPATSSTITNAKANSFGNGGHIQLGIYNNQEITGTLNYNVAPSVTNGYVAYASGAFGNAETGSLVMQLNGAIIHTINLTTTTGSGNPATGSDSYLNASGSGFIDMSVTASSFDGNNSEWHIFKHRTAGFKVAVANQAAGSNRLIIYHEIGTTKNHINGIVWVNDPDGAAAALTVSNPRIENVYLTGSKYVSGVRYNTDLTASYKANINNMYKNVFPSTNNTITFTPTNSTSPSAQSVPNIGGSENNTKVLGLTASVNYNGTYLLNGTIGMNLSATHPLKSNLSTTGSATITGMLIDADTSTPNSNLSETFEDEDFRIASGAYATQGSISSGTWNSTAHITSSGLAGHDDGMLIFNRRLYNPTDADVPNGGNFSTLANVSPGQPNYSAQSGIRTYFRKIQNTSGGDKYDFKITSQKNGFKFNEDSVDFDNNDAHLLAKIPGKTGWMNIAENFAYGSTANGDGCYISTATANSNRIGAANSVHAITFGTESVAHNDYLLIKIETNGIWGYVSKLDFTLGASSETPSSAPVLDDIDLDATGTGARLSFGSSNAVSGFSNAQGSGIGSMSTFNTNGVYTISGDRRGIFTSLANISGTLNEDVGANSNYTADSFFNGYSGSLVLEVNGVTVHTTNLTTTLGALSSNYNGQNSGFNLSAVGYSTTTDGVPRYIKPYRTGTYQIGAANQRVGWNYARVIHGGTTTNYVEWIVDTSGAVDNTAVSTPVLSDFNHGDIYYQSGVKYFASRPSASFQYTASNFYSNVHSDDSDAISFGTTTNCSISNIKVVGTGIVSFDSAVAQTSMPSLDNSADCEAGSIEVTGTVLFDNLTSISGGLGLYTKYDASVASTVKHPFKTNKTTSTLSKTAFMVYSGAVGSTNLGTQEYFNTEDYRIVSGNYVNQAAVIDAGNVWNPQTPMNGGNVHDDGMATVNGFAISPFQIGKSGDTRNNAEGSTGLQAPAGNPNYSTLTNSTRTFYRYFRYTSASTVASFTVTLHGDANLVGKTGTYAAALGANKNVFVEVKIPYDPNYSGADDQSTGWADAAKIFEASNQPNNDGAGIRAGSFSGEDQTIDSGGLALSLTLGTRRIKQNQYIVVKVSAHKDWTGYLSRIQVAY
jgi:hypothetical protein